jgi:hypothetical protein
MKGKPRKIFNFFKNRNETQNIQYDTINEDRVHLRDFLGIKPGIYLTVIYSIILLIILFFVLVYPGLSKPGSLLILTTEPQGAALRIDNVYAGTSPAKIFVDRGDHTLELIMPGFTPIKYDCFIPGRIFASKIFPKHYQVKAELTTEDPKAVLIDAAKDYAAWTFGGEPTDSWQIPLSLSEGVYRIAAKGEYTQINDILAASFRFAVTKAALRDIVRAKTLSDNSGLSPSPFSLINSSKDIIKFISETRGAAEALKNLLSAENNSLPAILENIAAYNLEINELSLENSIQKRPPQSSLNLGSLNFLGISGVSFPGFMICATEVTPYASDIFLSENPQWKAEQVNNLVEQGLVSEEYLIDDKPQGIVSGGICSISWYAADAYCKCLGTRLPASMADYEVRLPKEAEWAHAIQTYAGQNSVQIPREVFISDKLWEWCLDPYAPLDYVSAPHASIESLGSVERSLRGIIAQTEPLDFQKRASLPPAWCSSFVSFRPVIALKNQNG